MTSRSKFGPAWTPAGALRSLAICAGSILVVAGCGSSSVAASPPPPEIRLESVQFRAWRGSDPTASGTAAEAVYRRTSGAVEATDVQVTLPATDAPSTEILAPVVVGDLPDRTWSGSGGVVLVRGDATARTPSARYAARDGMVRGDEPVLVTGPGYRLTGPAFTADPATGDVAVRGGVRLVVSGAGRP